MPRISIACQQGSVPGKADLLRNLSEHDVGISGIKVEASSCLVYCNSDKDVDNLFSPECIASLSSLRCKPVLPPQLRAKRTVLLHRVDEVIYENDPQVILQEIVRCNPELIVDDVYKFVGRKILKVTFSMQQMASRCMERGIRMFHLVVSPNSISLDSFVEIDICYRCYKLNDHKSVNCTEDKDYKICSLCSTVGHTYKSCTSNVKKCINCSKPHNTMSLSCPVRRKIADDKRKEERNQRTFAARVSNSHSVSENVDQHNQLFSCLPNASEMSNILCKASLCLMIASRECSVGDDNFEKVLNDLLRINNLPDFKMGNVFLPKPTQGQIFDTVENTRSPTIILPGGSSVNTSGTISNTKADEGTHTETNRKIVNEPCRNATAKPIDIVLYRKKGVEKICESNFELLLSERKVIIESDLMLQDCVKLLKADFSLCKVLDLPVREFNSRLVPKENNKPLITNFVKNNAK